jgi:hypothetical protein
VGRTKETAVEEPKEVDRDELRSIAVYQKGILICILIYFVAVIAQFALPPALRLFLAIPVLGVIVAATVFVFLLATKVYSTGIGVLLAILTLIPFVGLIVLLVINGKATTVMKRNGVAVGLLGARMSDLK